MGISTNEGTPSSSCVCRNSVGFIHIISSGDTVSREAATRALDPAGQRGWGGPIFRRSSSHPGPMSPCVGLCQGKPPNLNHSFENLPRGVLISPPHFMENKTQAPQVGAGPTCQNPGPVGAFHPCTTMAPSRSSSMNLPNGGKTTSSLSSAGQGLRHPPPPPLHCCPSGSVS